ncbi:CO dehydrogenase accessory protein CooC (nickel insertion), partial [hydrothermal vent metagenome]
MKIAVAGKGGVGKTTFSGSLARLLGEENAGKVFAIDADPNTNLASSIGFTYEEASEFTPLIEMKTLIEERTGAAPGSMGEYFKLNPKVDDLPDRFKKEFKGVMFLLTGAMKEPSSGCYCPENALLKN